MAPPGEAGASTSSVGEDLAQLMDHVTGEVRCLLHEVQEVWKRGQDRWRQDVVFQAGDEVLLDTTFTPLPSRCLLSARWQGPFKVIGPAAAPNTYQLELPLTWRAHNEFNVDRLHRYARAPDWMVADRQPRPSREVSQVLLFLNHHCCPSCLVRWVGEDASRDSWEPVATSRRPCVTSSWLRGPGSHVPTLPRPTPLPSPRLPGAAIGGDHRGAGGGRSRSGILGR